MWLRVTNDCEHSRRVVAEPWGDYVELEPGASIGVFWHGPSSAYISIVETREQIELWAEGSRDVLLEIDRRGEIDNEVTPFATDKMPPRFHTRSDLV